MNQQIIWKQVNHPDILPGYLVSPEGYIKANDVDDKDCTKEPTYHSTNGYDFMLLYNKDKQLQLFPIDDIIALTYIPIPKELKHKPIKVLHINGDTRDISLDNLQWIEDVEEWKIIHDNRIIENRYKISNFGNIMDITKNTLINKHINGRGYYNVNLLRSSCESNNRKFITVSLHSLIAKHFLVRNNHKDVVNHIDGIKINNKPKNLEYVSTERNTYHAILTYLKDHISEETINYVRMMLDKWKYPRLVCKYADYQKYPEINRDLIINIKRKWYYNRGTNPKQEYHPGKMTVAEMDMVRDLLLQSHDHSCKIAYDKIDHEMYPHITLQMVKEIKSNKYSTYNKSEKYDLSKLKFDKTPQPCKLSVIEIDMIRDILMENNGCCRKSYNIGKYSIPKLTIYMVEDIRRGKSYLRSVKYDLSKSKKYPFILK